MIEGEVSSVLRYVKQRNRSNRESHTIENVKNRSVSPLASPSMKKQQLWFNVNNAKSYVLDSKAGS